MASDNPPKSISRRSIFQTQPKFYNLIIYNLSKIVGDYNSDVKRQFETKFFEKKSVEKVSQHKKEIQS
jgi:hypothetical protein